MNTETSAIPVDRPPLPDELRGLTPRSVPPDLWDAPSMAKTRRGCLIALASGFVITLLGLAPIMKTWGLYFLPLAYLTYIGIVIVAISLWYLIRFWTTGGNLRYVEKADAAMAQIRDIQIDESELNGVKSYTPRFSVIYEDAALGESAQPILREQVLSAPGITADKLAVSKLRFHAGDWVPVVWFPGKAETSATLYDCLGLNETGIWTTEDSPALTPLWLTLVLIGTTGFFFFCLIWSLWAVGAYSPIETPPTTVIALSIGLGLCIAILMAGLIYWHGEYEKRRATTALERNLGDSPSTSTATDTPVAKTGFFAKLLGSVRGAFMLVVMAAGGVLLSSLVVYELMVTANALFDESAGEIEIAKIDDLIQVTHNGVFREYKIEYQLPARGELGQGLSLISTPEHMSTLQFDTAIAIVKPGAFGWPWVSEIVPVRHIVDEK